MLRFAERLRRGVCKWLTFVERGSNFIVSETFISECTLCSSHLTQQVCPGYKTLTLRDCPLSLVENEQIAPMRLSRY